jgi:hypothetical protein
MRIIKKDIALDFYKGAYGPTLRIDVQTLDALIGFRKLLFWVGESEGHTINLVEQDNIETTGLDKLILRCAFDGEKSHKKLTLTSSAEPGIAFEWTRSSEGWKELCCLFDPLIEHDRPGHQYLTQEGDDDALVELAFKE